MIYITQSMVKIYKACRRKYYLAYVEKLVPIAKSEALEMGSSYHNKVESIIKNGMFEITNDKTDAMALAFEKYIAPSLGEIEKVEEEFTLQIADNVTIIGKIDAIGKGNKIIEHKTTGSSINEDYVYGLNWDEQAPMYMLARGTNEMTYAVIQKPTIRQKQNEILEEYLQRCVDWYEDKKEKKVKLFKVVRNKTEIEEKKQEFIRIAEEMQSCEFFYTNPSYCTAWGRRCEFAPICLNYDPKFLPIEFMKKAKRNEELEQKMEVF
jgi:hypothetical protein